MYNAYWLDSDFDVVDAAKEVAKERGVSTARIALAWMLHKPYVTAPIIGIAKMEYLEDLVAAMDTKLSEEEISKLEMHYKAHPATF